MSQTEGSGLPLRESGVACENCGTTTRRPDSNHCAGCGNFAPDPAYARSPVTGNWYRVTEYHEAGDGRIVAKEKEAVEKDEVPEHWVEAIEEAMVDA